MLPRLNLQNYIILFHDSCVSGQGSCSKFCHEDYFGVEGCYSNSEQSEHLHDFFLT